MKLSKSKPKYNHALLSTLTGFAWHYSLFVYYVYILILVLADDSFLWRHCILSATVGGYSLSKSFCVSSCISSKMRVSLFNELSQATKYPDHDVNTCHASCAGSPLYLYLVNIMSMGLLSVQWDSGTQWYRIGPSGLAYYLQPDYAFATLQRVMHAAFYTWPWAQSVLEYLSVFIVQYVTVLTTAYGKANLIAMVYVMTAYTIKVILGASYRAIKTIGISYGPTCAFEIANG